MRSTAPDAPVVFVKVAGSDQRDADLDDDSPNLRAFVPRTHRDHRAARISRHHRPLFAHARLRQQIRHRRDRVVDFTGTAPQIRGFKNSSLANTYSAVYAGIASFFDSDLPT